MRIVGGKFKGRGLAVPRSNAIRPTTDRTRESLFNILLHGYRDILTGCRMLDLFAGTGAVGLEALSRGARFALFVEQSTEGRALLRANIETLGASGCTKVYRRNATELGNIGQIEPFDVVFADPPYGKGLGERALGSAASGGWLRAGALVMLEERADMEPELTDGFVIIESRMFGDTAIHFYHYRPDPEPQA
jgi:16S rRNA (guanine966-N2)-methyltransferase